MGTKKIFHKHGQSITCRTVVFIIKQDGDKVRKSHMSGLHKPAITGEG